MSLPIQDDLLGLDWGYSGGVFAPLAAKSTLDPGAPEWSIGGVPVFFAGLDAADDAADRAITALNAMVLMGNPSDADALITATRAMVLRTTAADDADRRITKLQAQALLKNPSTADAILTALRVAVLRTQDDPNADRRVTKVLASVIRSVRRGDMAKPGAQGRVIFNDSTFTPGQGEYSPRGYFGIAAPEVGWTGFPYLDGVSESGYTINRVEPIIGPQKSPYPVGYGGGGEIEDLSTLIRRWHEGLTQRTPAGFIKPLYNVTFLGTTGNYPYPLSVYAMDDDSPDIPSNNHGPGGEGNFPLGLHAAGVTQSTFGFVYYPFFYSKINADYTIVPSVLGLMRTMTDPHPDAQQWALPAFTIVNNVAATYQTEYTNGTGNAPHTFTQVVDLTFPTGTYGVGPDEARSAPRLTISSLMGRGAYRIAPGSYRDVTVLDALLPQTQLPSQGDNDPFEEHYGTVFGSEKILWEQAFVNNVDITPMNLDWPTPPEHTFQSTPSNLERFPGMLHRWGPAWFPSFGGGTESIGKTIAANEDGLYINRDGEKRYSRFQTVMMVQYFGYDRQLNVHPDGMQTTGDVTKRTRAHLPLTFIGAYGVSEAVWDGGAVTGKLVEVVEALEPGISTELADWLTAQPEFPTQYLAFTGDEAEEFWTRYLTEFRPAYLAAVQAAWVIGRNEAENTDADFTKSYRATFELAWDADDFDPTVYEGSVCPPVLYLEKLDSPSTHFNDPPGTPGVDDF